MNVRIVERPERDDVAVYCWHDLAKGREEIDVDANGRLVPGADVIEGAELRPTLVFKMLEWAALTEAIRREGPAGSVEKDALVDTRKVRDRLLALVEQAWPK